MMAYNFRLSSRNKMFYLSKYRIRSLAENIFSCSSDFAFISASSFFIFLIWLRYAYKNSDSCFFMTNYTFLSISSIVLCSSLYASLTHFSNSISPFSLTTEPLIKFISSIINNKFIIFIKYKISLWWTEKVLKGRMLKHTFADMWECVNVCPKRIDESFKLRNIYIFVDLFGYWFKSICIDDSILIFIDFLK